MNKNISSQVYQCILFLSERCDYASSKDGQGFSAVDAPLGHALAEANIKTEPELIAGCKMVRKYKGQLLKNGLAIQKILDYLKNQKRTVKTIKKRDIVRGTASICGSKIILRTKYNPSLIIEIKILLQHKWQGSHWEVAACQENADRVKDICDRYGIDLSDDPEWDRLKPILKARLLMNKNILSISGGYLPTDRWLANSANPNKDEQGFYALQRNSDKTITYTMTMTTWNIHKFLLWIENKDLLNNDMIGSVIKSARTKVIACFQECAAREKSKRIISNAISLTPSSEVLTNWLDESGKTLMPHQECAIKAILENKQILVADEQGLGKTIEALVAIEVSNAWPAVVLCPAIAKLNWRDEAEKWLPKKRKIKVLGVPKRDEGWHDKNPDLYILNYEIFNKNTQLLRNCKTFVADEAQYLKGYKSSRTSSVKDFLQETKPEYRIFMTGTPIMNRPSELLTVLTLLPRCLSALGGFGYFAARYCRAEQVEISAWTSFLDMSGSANLEELANRLRSSCLIRREKKDVLPDLFSKQYEVKEVVLSNAIEYETASSDFERWLNTQPRKKGEKRRVDPDDEDVQWMDDMAITGLNSGARHEALRKIGALRRLVGVGKIESSAHIIEEFVKDEKLVVFCYHKDVQLQLAKYFPNALKITGEQSPNVRASMITKFQTMEEYNLIICSLKAAQTAITLTAARRAVFIEMDWTPSAIHQAEDRIHRIGQQKQVIITQVIAPKTLDDRMAELLLKKNRNYSAASELFPIKSGNFPSNTMVNASDADMPLRWQVSR